MVKTDLVELWSAHYTTEYSDFSMLISSIFFFFRDSTLRRRTSGMMTMMIPLRTDPSKVLHSGSTEQPAARTLWSLRQERGEVCYLPVLTVGSAMTSTEAPPAVRRQANMLIENKSFRIWSRAKLRSLVDIELIVV